jgi:5-methyltetrahydropteroyltriglutamate--homocysteine methyltransferase
MDLVEDRAAYEKILRRPTRPAFAIKNETVWWTRSGRGGRSPSTSSPSCGSTTKKPIMVPLPGPYILARSMWVKGVSDKAYPTREHLAVDVVKILS